MIYIFHGDDQAKSRSAFSQAMLEFRSSDILNIDSKSFDENQVYQFINSPSLLLESKTIAISNLFSLPKLKLDKIINNLKLTDHINVFIWQDKGLTSTQLKLFPQAKVQYFKADNLVFTTLNQVRPKNLSQFLRYYHQLLNKDLLDLFLYLLKNNLRRQLSSSKFDSHLIKTTYLNIIELEYQNKTGTLAIQREIALERLMIKLLS
jgi:hypothetical protein